MGQQDIYNFLKDHPNEWFTSRDISKGIKTSVCSATVCLKRLRENNDVRYKATAKKGKKRAHYLYKFKK